MSEFAAAFIVGLLAMIAYALSQIDGRLRAVADELRRQREDNAAWRESAWEREQR